MPLKRLPILMSSGTILLLSYFGLTMLKFNNCYLDNLPADLSKDNVSRQVENAAYSLVAPKKTSSPKLIIKSEPVANMLGLELDDEQLATIFTGNQLLQGMQPYAMNYGGHQFGHWAGQLGDGRAINLGQIDTEKYGNLTIQLKGAGPTPYSRHADGFAVLRSSVREFLCSEAMHGLGIPTTRALSLCLTGDKVVRDMFYDGNPQEELGAVVCRVSPSFMRFGVFQLPASRGDIDLLRQLVDHCIVHDYSHLGEPSKDVYIEWFAEVCDRTCDLIIEWMRVGFVHGVLNTDNMSIIGETIDYGPYGWIDNFDLNWTPNTTDAQGKRYAFGAQPEIGQWNLFQLANTIFPLVEDAQPLQDILNGYATRYKLGWNKMMAAKLGLSAFEGQQDTELFIELEELLSAVPTDMTIFYRLLATEQLPDLVESYFAPAFYQDSVDAEHIQRLEKWLNKYFERVEQDNLDAQYRMESMNKVNPKFVLRNYLSQQAIELAEKGDYSMIHDLLKVMKAPYSEQPEFDSFAQKRPKWAENKAGCSMLSCSS